MSETPPTGHGAGTAIVAALLLFSCTCTAASLAGEPQQDEHLLGKAHFAVSCSDEAQESFNRGVSLLLHMTYPHTRSAFQGVAKLDPDCAMAHWGIAMTLFQPLWPTRPGPNELQQGWDAVQNARAPSPPTEREQLYIAAAESFYRNRQESDYWERIRRWEDAMETRYRTFPDNPEANVFYALAHFATGRASGTAHLGDVDDASHANDRLQALEDVSNGSGEQPFTRQIRILRLAVSAWIARVRGKGERALQLMQKAAGVEIDTPKSPVTPAPTLSAHELLGNLSMEMEKPDQSLAAFKRSLKLRPKRFNTLLRAARAARSLEDERTAETFYASLLTTGDPGSNRTALREARE